MNARVEVAIAEINARFPGWSPSSLMLGYARAVASAVSVGYETEPTGSVISALDGVLVGGNHLGLLIGADHPPWGATHTEALEYYGAGDKYEIWCCWDAIMRLAKVIVETREINASPT